MVADALTEVPSDQAAEFLLELLAGTDDKVFGKSLRRSLNEHIPNAKQTLETALGRVEE